MAVEDGGFDEVEVLNAIPRGTGKHNPALDYTPTWRGYDDAMDRLTYDPERLANGWMESDGTANFATEAQARLIQVLVTNVVQSRLERNPADFAYQARLYDSASFIADSEDAHGRSIQSLAIDVPTAGARGLFVSIPADMGEHSLVNSVERFIGTSSHRFYVDAQAGGRFDVSLVKSLTVPFPETGSPRSFVDTMLKKMDSVVNGGYSTHKTGPFHRDRDDLANAMSGLAIQHNLGALLVPNLTAKAVTQSAAWVLLGPVGPNIVSFVVQNASKRISAVVASRSGAATTCCLASSSVASIKRLYMCLAKYAWITQRIQCVLYTQATIADVASGRCLKLFSFRTPRPRWKLRWHA